MASRVTRRSAVTEKAFLASLTTENVLRQSSNSPTTLLPKNEKPTLAKSKAAVSAQVKESKPVTPTLANTGKKRKRGAAVKVEEDINELPHNLGKALVVDDADVKEEVKEAIASSPSNPRSVKPAVNEAVIEDVLEVAGKATATDTAFEETPTKQAKKTKATTTKASVKIPSAKKARKVKANPYGITPGETPYPDWPHPTPEECHEVNEILSEIHGRVAPPKEIPTPSMTVSGCGEVPSVLDAIIRTVLSAHTADENSNNALKGLVRTFGILKEGIGKGSIDWDTVRRADLKTVESAIKCGGLAKTKSEHIKGILDMVYEQNTARRDALLAAKEAGIAAEPLGAGNESEAQKEVEITQANENVLSLDYLHALPTDDIFNTLIKFPGVGVKTTACTLLFCLRRPSFAVDTHVWRLCQWLKWVPEKATRDSTYAHCDVKVPDELKYSLHQLFIRHGKKCPRCRAVTGVASQGWEEGCAIDHLVTRTGTKKGGIDVAGKGKKKDGKGKGKNVGKKGKKSGGSEKEDEEKDEMQEIETDVKDDMRGKGRKTAKKVQGNNTSTMAKAVATRGRNRRTVKEESVKEDDEEEASKDEDDEAEGDQDDMDYDEY
ncbi:hypothetical protein MMC12_004902 [Toensbergia leucococca]|nr:hypothetical protein [Toensbergia leucococca]